MSHYFERFLADIFKAEGAPDPEGAAKRASEAMHRAQLIDDARVAKAERDAKIYELRKEMTTEDLSIRFDLHRREIFKIVKIQKDIRKTG